MCIANAWYLEFALVRLLRRVTAWFLELVLANALEAAIQIKLIIRKNENSNFWRHFLVYAVCNRLYKYKTQTLNIGIVSEYTPFFVLRTVLFINRALFILSSM